jgi:RNA polymerase sigma-70 factor (sigma-E family)
MNGDEPLDFETYVRTRSNALMRYGFVLTGNAHDAADLVQDALVRLRGSWHRIQRRGALDAYVRTTMTRLYVRLWRRRQREWSTSAPPDRPHTDAAIEAADGDDGLREALSALPRRQRAVLVLRYYEQLTDEEIADVLGISRGTVRSQAARGLDKLRTAWLPTIEHSRRNP